MFEKTREVVRKDKFGFPEEEFQHRAVIMGTPHAGLSRKELSLMAGHDPILAGDIQENPAYDRHKPLSCENFLFRATVTADLLGGTRNLVFDGSMLHLVHGERTYSLRDEALIRRRAAQLGIKAKELEKVVEGLEQRILLAIAEVRPSQATQPREAFVR
jgi:hypothetical protein